MVGRRVEEGGKERRRARRGQGSPQLTRTGGESPLASGWWRKNWIKNMLPYPRRDVCKDDSNKKNAVGMSPDGMLMISGGYVSIAGNGAFGRGRAVCAAAANAGKEERGWDGRRKN